MNFGFSILDFGLRKKRMAEGGDAGIELFSPTSQFFVRSDRLTSAGRGDTA
jgi:hypothetical protein